uniref:YqaJ viral recombinase domain-containing protein n=1 Tax=Daphnia galeata TaxID=27404 RepID=A0A8J2WHK1_9CRUS|nr:unnamed protein product [Daphnia galeata]
MQQYELAELPFLPVCLSNITEYSDRFKSLAETHNVPNLLTELYNPEFEGKPDVVVNEECERIFETISFSKKDQEAVEIATRDQSVVSEWKKKRAGRITGTKRVFNFKFQSQLTSGDIKIEYLYRKQIYQKNKPIAAKLIEKHIQENNIHTNFSLKPVGFVIALSTSYIGALPDRLTQCDCCGRCVMEIKCPSTLEGKDIDERIKTDKSFFLQINPETEEMYLLQLYVTKSRKGIFGVYNGAGEIKHVQIERDEDCIAMMVAKSKLFFFKLSVT